MQNFNKRRIYPQEEQTIKKKQQALNECLDTEQTSNFLFDQVSILDLSRLWKQCGFCKPISEYKF